MKLKKLTRLSDKYFDKNYLQIGNRADGPMNVIFSEEHFRVDYTNKIVHTALDMEFGETVLPDDADMKLIRKMEWVAISRGADGTYSLTMGTHNPFNEKSEIPRRIDGIIMAMVYDPSADDFADVMGSAGVH